jgi:hypothetical protein
MKVCGQIHAPAALFPAKNPGIEQDGPQRRSGLFGEEKNVSPLSAFEPWIIQPVAQSHYRLPFLDYEFKTGLEPHPKSIVSFGLQHIA